MIDDMNYEVDQHEKLTEPVLDWMKMARENDQAELIVRAKDPSALEPPQYQDDEDIETIQQRERQYSDQIMGNLVRFIHDLEYKGKNVRLLNTSWLTHSALVVGTPPIIRILTKRDDVDLIDVNAEVRMIH